MDYYLPLKISIFIPTTLKNSYQINDKGNDSSKHKVVCANVNEDKRVEVKHEQCALVPVKQY